MKDIVGYGVVLNSDGVSLEKTVYTALDDACEVSERGGRWSSILEVGDYAGLDAVNTKDALITLVKKSLAEEKIASSGRNLGLFRPTELGASSYGNSFPFDDQFSKDPGKPSLKGDGKDPGSWDGKKGTEDEFDKAKVPQGKDSGTNEEGKNEGNDWGKSSGDSGDSGDNFPNFKLPKKSRKNSRPKGKMKPAWDDSKPKHNGGGSEPIGDGLGFPKGAMKGLGEFGKPDVPIKNNNYIDPKIPLINPDDYQEYNQKPFKGPIPEPDPIKPGEKVGQDVGNMAATIITSALFGGAMGGMSGASGVAGGAGRMAMPSMRHQRRKCGSKKGKKGKR
jgi:hypothetical protein